MIMLTVSFFPSQNFINNNIISEARSNYRRGSAQLTPDSSQLVNRLLVRGGKQLSEPYDQAITVGADPIPLYYKPRAPDDESITVVVDGSEKTVGIQHLTDKGTKDFLVNVNEKLLIPDQCTSGSGTITYRYEYPIKFILEDYQSQEDYGRFDDILRVDYDDYHLVLDAGLRHLAKYSRPVLRGSVEPFRGTYFPGQLIKVEITSLKINEYLKIKDVTYDSIPGEARVDRQITLESTERELPNILKDFNSRLAKLEKQVYQDEDGPVIKYIARSELWGWTEEYLRVDPAQVNERVNWSEGADRQLPVSVGEETSWIESMGRIDPVNISDRTNWTEGTNQTINACPVPSDNLYPGEDVIPC